MTKVLRPWYSAACRQAKHQLLCTRRACGATAAATRAAAAAYHVTLRQARRHFAANLEGLRLCSPKDFWRLLRPPPPPLTIAPHLLHAHYTNLLGAAPPSGEPATSPLPPTQVEPFSSGEVAAAVARLRTNKSLGGHWLSPELLRLHTDDQLYEGLAVLLNTAALHGIPPSWTTSTLTSIHKRGPKDDPANYRGLAVQATLPKLYA